MIEAVDGNANNDKNMKIDAIEQADDSAIEAANVDALLLEDIERTCP